MENRHHKKTVFLPFHPYEKPKSLKAVRNVVPMSMCPPLQSNQFVPFTAVPQISTNINGVNFHPFKSFHPAQNTSDNGWQENWMKMFNETRQEQNTTIDDLKNKTKQRDDEIIKLKREKDDLLAEIAKREAKMSKLQGLCDKAISKIGKIKEKCAKSHKSKVELTHNSSQTVIEQTDETTQTVIEQATETTQTDEPAESPIIQEPQDMATGTELLTVQLNIQPSKYKCEKCLKYFGKKSSLDDHKSETACAGGKEY